MGFFANLARRFRADGFPLVPLYPTTGPGKRSRMWRPSGIGPNAALDYNAIQLRNQSRDLARKNALASAAIDRVVAAVVGTGIKPQISDAKAQDLWLRWTDEADAAGMLDFYGLEGQVAAAVVTAGECFARLRTRKASDGLSVPLQIEVLEAEFVRHDLNRVEPSGNVTRQGIEFDANLKSKRVAYWMLPRHPYDGGPQIVDMTPFRVPAAEVVHIFQPTRPGQIRGEPWLTRAIDRLLDVESYDKAELIRKKTSAMLVGFVQRNLPSDASLDDLKSFWGDDGAEIHDGHGDVTLEPGTMQFLAPGESVEFADPKDVGGQYEVFMRSQHRAIAAAIGILYEHLSGDYSQVNDRTWRAAMNDFRRRVEMWQHHLIVFQFCRPIFARWASLAQISGGIGRRFDVAAPVKWTPQAWPYINPLQDVQAKREEVRAGFMSRSSVASERGEDSEVIDEENAKDNARADKLGLVYDSDGRVAVSKGANPNTTGVEDPTVDPGQQVATPDEGK